MDVPMEVFVSPNVPMELTSSEDKQFELDDIAYNFYNEYEYERMTSFSIRKKYVNKCNKIGIVTSRRFMCEKEGIWGCNTLKLFAYFGGNSL